MRTAFIVDTEGVVTDPIVVEDDTDLAALGTLLNATIVFGPEDAGRGWTLNGSTWTAPVGIVPQPTLPELFEQARQLVEDHVNDMARTRRYTDAVSCASYVSSTNETWSAEATAFVAWRDAVWAQVYVLEDKVLAGELGTIPTADELIAGLPAFAWPT